MARRRFLHVPALCQSILFLPKRFLVQLNKQLALKGRLKKRKKRHLLHFYLRSSLVLFFTSLHGLWRKSLRAAASYIPLVLGCECVCVFLKPKELFSIFPPGLLARSFAFPHSDPSSYWLHPSVLFNVQHSGIKETLAEFTSSALALSMMF